MALQALLCDPVINSTKAAQGIVEELFAINAAYIRKCV
jgi:alpha-galactosidase